MSVTLSVKMSSWKTIVRKKRGKKRRGNIKQNKPDWDAISSRAASYQQTEKQMDRDDREAQLGVNSWRRALNAVRPWANQNRELRLLFAVCGAALEVYQAFLVYGDGNQDGQGQEARQGVGAEDHRGRVDLLRGPGQGAAGGRHHHRHQGHQGEVRYDEHGRAYMIVMLDNNNIPGQDFIDPA